MAVKAFEFGYRKDRSVGWVLANGIESAWTVEGWRHAGDQRADRYAHQPLWIIFMSAASSAGKTVASEAAQADVEMVRGG